MILRNPRATSPYLMALDYVQDGVDPVDAVDKANEHALALERHSGIPPGQVGIDGVTTPESYRYQLIQGSPDPRLVSHGMVLWDPTSTDTVLIIPTTKGVVVRQGPVQIRLGLGKSAEDRVAAGALDYLERAFTIHRPLASRWLLSYVDSLLRDMLQESGEDAVDLSSAKALPANPKKIWAYLREYGVAPWPEEGL